MTKNQVKEPKYIQDIHYTGTILIDTSSTGAVPGVSNSWDCTVLHGIYIFTWLFFGPDASIFEGEAEKPKTSEARKPTTRYIESKHEQIRRIVEKSDKVKAKIMKRKAEWDEL